MLVLAASMALLLGLGGIDGVIAYAVTHRTREIDETAIAPTGAVGAILQLTFTEPRIHGWMQH